MESFNHSLSYTIPPFVTPRQGQSTQQHGLWHGGPQGLIRPSDREKLGQSAIGIALYQGPMDTFLDSTNYLPYPCDRTTV